MNGAVRTLVGVSIGVVIVTGSLTPAQATPTTGPTQPSENLKVFVTGVDGRSRAVIKADAGEQSSRVSLQPGDSLNLGADRKTVTGIDAVGNAFMTLSAPELRKGDKAVDAVFAVDGTEISMIPSAGTRAPRHACRQH